MAAGVATLPNSGKRYYKAVLPTDDPAVFRSKQVGSDGREVLWRVGQTNFLDKAPGLALCRHGFHACAHAAAPFVKDFCYGYERKESVLLEVLLHGEVETDGVKFAALGCTPLRIVQDEEWAELVKGETTLTCVGFSFGMTSRVEVCLVDGTCFWSKLERKGEFEEIEEWRFRGLRHRDYDLPTIVFSDGTKMWFRNGVKHRNSGKPAVVRSDGLCEWWADGRKYLVS